MCIYYVHFAIRFVVGLHENDLVKCALIADVLNLRSVHVTPVSAKDWEIIVSAYLSMYACACVFACVCSCGQIKILLYRISFWRGRASKCLFMCSRYISPALPLTPAGNSLIRVG